MAVKHRVTILCVAILFQVSCDKNIAEVLADTGRTSRGQVTYSTGASAFDALMNGWISGDLRAMKKSSSQTVWSSLRKLLAKGRYRETTIMEISMGPSNHSFSVAGYSETGNGTVYAFSKTFVCRQKAGSWRVDKITNWHRSQK